MVAELLLNWDKFGALLPVCDALLEANLPKLKSCSFFLVELGVYLVSFFGAVDIIKELKSC